MSRVAVVVMLCGSALASAQSGPAPAPAKPTVELGFEERVRMEDWDDIVDHSSATQDERTQYRFRSRLWASWKPSARLEAVAGIINENRKITEPDVAYHGREVVFETLWIDWKLGRGWAVRPGRQNLMRGEGFVLFDGTPLDGSRTAYFNALDAYRTFGKSKIELLAITDPRTDQYLPRFNEGEKAWEQQRLVEWDERAVGVYVTYAELPRTGLEGYVFYKTETDDYRTPTHPQFQPDRRLGVVGGRVVQSLGRGVSLIGEAAYEAGRQDALPGSSDDTRDLRAWGGYVRLKKELGGKVRPTISLAYIGMSGDDPGTTTIEGWDPLFSRWPKWSELYIYSLTPETGVAYWTNTGMWEAEIRLSPAKPLALRATYYRMEAYESLGARGGAFGPGTTRGDLVQVRADLTVGKSWKGHVLYEHLAPGDFYSGQDGGYFLRLEVTYTFKQVY